MPNYNIADIHISISLDIIGEIPTLDQFKSPLKGPPKIDVFITSSNTITQPPGKLIMNEGFPWFEVDNDGNIAICVYDENGVNISYELKVNATWDTAYMTYHQDVWDPQYLITGALGEILFRNNLILHQGIVIHASAIDWNGQGIIFSAPSETGKSTQAKLWKDLMGAKILNGDRPALRIVNSIAKVYGTPWSGSSNEFINASVPLSAIVMLEQAPQNSIKKLSPLEAISKLMPRVFLPYHNKDMLQLAITNVEAIITSVPIFLLKCKPDKESVNLVYEQIRRNAE